jgi:hypothetical protein
MNPPFFLIFFEDVKNQDSRILSPNQQIHPEDLLSGFTPRFTALGYGNFFSHVLKENRK